MPEFGDSREHYYFVALSQMPLYYKDKKTHFYSHYREQTNMHNCGKAANLSMKCWS